MAAETVDQSRRRGLQVFRYLQALNEVRNPVTRNLKDQPWSMFLSDLPKHECIRLGRSTTDNDPGDSFVLRVERAKFLQCPRPPDTLTPWLKAGWDDPGSRPEWRAELATRDSNGATVSVKFDDDPRRVADWKRWTDAWNTWSPIETVNRQAFQIFERLYELHGRLQRESERFELLVGDGWLNWRRSEGGISHPILLQRLMMEFDATAAVFTISESDELAELYTALFRHLPDVEGRVLSRLRTELEQGGFTPLDRESSAFLRGVATSLASAGEFQEHPSSGPVPSAPVISRQPVLFLRPRAAGFATALEDILHDLQHGAGLPLPLQRVVGIAETAPTTAGSAAPKSEAHVLFTKAANTEQFAIAEQLDRHGSVLVQGPPGTGKTHTIANIVGHLLAAGKRVLVTSHTTKALRVLREKVVGPLQPLCVSVLDSDLDSRGQLESSIAEIVRRLGDNADAVERHGEQLQAARADLLRRIDDCNAQLLSIREGEYRDIGVGDERRTPAEAARIVAAGTAAHSWIPGRVEAGRTMPLTDAEVGELYATNELVSMGDEEAYESTLPELGALMPPATFEQVIEEREALGAGENLDSELRLWNTAWTEQALTCVSCRKMNRIASQAMFRKVRCGHCKGALYPTFDRELDASPEGHWESLTARVNDALRGLNVTAPWHLTVIEEGAGAEQLRQRWLALANQIRDVNRRSLEALERQIEFAPRLGSFEKLDEQLGVATEILEHLDGGSTLGVLTLTFRSGWRTWLKTVSVLDGPPATVEHVKALIGEIELAKARRQLAARWQKVAVTVGASSPTSDTEIENALKSAAEVIETCLAWHHERWRPIEDDLTKSGLRWSDLLQDTIVESGEHATLLRLRAALAKLEAVLTSHRARQRWMRASNALAALVNALNATGAEAAGEITAQLIRAVSNSDPEEYSVAYQRLLDVRGKLALVRRRRDLLAQIRGAAPEWADAIQRRVVPHHLSVPPGPVADAWLWAQLNIELKARGTGRAHEIERQLEECKNRVEVVTAELVERRAWAAQIRRISHDQRMALVGWADTIRRIGKGTGKRVPLLLQKARELMGQCRAAVPVWIMPLSRVADSFSASTRFDVVIVDEASQSDVMGLLALYMGDATIIVGDNEQVSPEAVGQDLTQVTHLIQEHLEDIPNGHLYDGRTSIYDLARQSFGGAIRLKEHFRCLPQIIQFSNDLSYEGEIQPLRDDSAVRVGPAVVEERVDEAVVHSKRNRKEMERVASLVAAVLEQPEYVDASIGVVSMVGEEQAYDIDAELRRRLPPAKVERHRVMCGNPAQFQGDERDIVFVSMVDAPEGRVLPLRADERFKKRFNVAASRAKDQMWVVHSLNPEIDLKADDLRRRLIEHAIDPDSRVQEWRRLNSKVDQRSGAFEKQVLRALLNQNFRVTPQFRVGAYVIDFVVEGEGARIALECDGDRYHTLENLHEDMARQAVLERRGWRFIRIRGTEYFRSPQETMNRVFERLEEQGIHPQAAHRNPVVPSANDLLRRVRERARQLREQWYDCRESRGDEVATGALFQ